MKLKSIALKNIGPHRELSVDFANLGNILAITGENGQGKTFLLESVVACLYGFFPFRAGSIKDRITWGYDGAAEITVEFELNGHIYKATRTIYTNTKPSEANLWKDGKLAVGPKVGDFENEIINLLGSKDLFLASVFSSQFNAGDLCAAKPGERKAVFGQLLGLVRFDQLSEAAKKKAQGAESEVEAQERTIKSLRDRAQGLQVAQDGLKAATGDKNFTEGKLDAQKRIVTDLEAKIKAGEIALEKWRGLDAQLKKADGEIDKLTREIENDREEYKRLKDLTARAPEVDQAEQGLAEATERKDALQKELAAAEKANSEARLVEEKHKSEISRATADLEAKRRDRARLWDRAKELEQTAKLDGCRTCKLVASAIKAKDELPEAILAEGLSENKLDTLQKNPPPAKYINTDHFEAELGGLTGRIDAARRLLADAPKIREAQGKLSALTETGKAKAATLAEKKAEREKLAQEAESNRQTAPDTSKLDIAKREQAFIERQLNEITSQIGALKERIISMEKDQHEADELEAGIAGKKQEVQDCRIIEQAFGRSGIQPLIIEQARPELETIACEILGEATDGKLAVRFDTQKENKDGSIAESLDIIITMDGQEHKIEEYSGGEQSLISTAIRLTLAVYQARKGNSRLRTLCLDEVDAALTQGNKGRMLKLLMTLQKQFDLIFIITHDDWLIGELPVRININKGKAEVIR